MSVPGGCEDWCHHGGGQSTTWHSVSSGRKLPRTTRAFCVECRPQLFIVSMCFLLLVVVSHLLPALLAHLLYFRACQAEEITGEEAWALKRSVLPLLSLKVDHRWVRRFKERWQWKALKANGQGAYLSYDDPRMEAARGRFAAMRAQHAVPAELCLNFDQLWKCSWVHPEKVLMPGPGHTTASRSKKDIMSAELLQRPEPEKRDRVNLRLCFVVTLFWCHLA